MISFTSGNKGHFSQSRTQLLQFIGNTLGILMQNAKLQDRQAQDMAEIKNRERELRNLLTERKVEVNIGRIISFPLNATDAYERFSAELRKIIDFDRIGLYNIDLERGLIETRFHHGEDLPESRTAPGISYRGTFLPPHWNPGIPVC